MSIIHLPYQNTEDMDLQYKQFNDNIPESRCISKLSNLPIVTACVQCVQILNLTQALKDGKSPVQLVQMPVVVVERTHKTYGKGRTRTSSTDTFTQKFGKRAPFFSWC